MTAASEFAGPVFVADSAPDVMITSVDIVRSVMQPWSPDLDDAESEGGPLLQWFIQAGSFLDQVGESHLRLFGDLAVRDQGWFIGVTSAVILDFRRDAVLDSGEWTTERLNEATDRFGGWASHVLYDTAAACARRLSVQSLVGGPEIPTLTPNPVYFHHGGEHEAESPAGAQP